MRNGLISVDAYKKSRAFYIYERKLRYCIEVFFRVSREWKRFNGKGSMCFCASEVSARGNAGVSAAMESGDLQLYLNILWGIKDKYTGFSTHYSIQISKRNKKGIKLVYLLIFVEEVSISTTVNFLGDLKGP